MERLLRTSIHYGELEHVKYRQSGNTTGKSLRIIGELMELNTPYSICVRGEDHNGQADKMLFSKTRALIEKLELDHFEFNANTLTIKYNIWYDL